MQFSGLCRLYSSVSLLALATALAAAFPRNEAVHAEDATIGINNFTFAPERLHCELETSKKKRSGMQTNLLLKSGRKSRYGERSFARPASGLSRYRGQSGREMLRLSSSQFAP